MTVCFAPPPQSYRKPIVKNSELYTMKGVREDGPDRCLVLVICKTWCHGAQDVLNEIPQLKRTIVGGRAVDNSVGILDEPVAAVLGQVKHSKLPWHDTDSENN